MEGNSDFEISIKGKTGKEQRYIYGIFGFGKNFSNVN